MPSNLLTTTFLTLALSVAITGQARAISDPANLGQWDKPAATGPDKEVPGFLVNLGPTGARAILKETSFVVKYVFPKSPADGQLRIDDEITGVNGKPFNKHTFGKCYGMEAGAGYEGPIMDMGKAIEDSEGKDGTLTLSLIRGRKPATVDIKLDPIGRFSDTFPRHCKKSEKLATRAMDYLIQHPEDRTDHVHEKGLLDYNKAFINMARTHDGAFVIQPGRNLHEKAYYMSPRIHPTAAMVIVLGTAKPRLRIQGVNGKPQP